MSRLLIAAAAAALLATSAAADEPVRWSGLYLGANIGHGALSADHTQTNGGMPYGPYDVDGAGLTGGAVLGYNLQAGSLVFGVEIEGGYMDITGRGRIPSSVPTAHQDIDVDTGWYGLAAARLGLVISRTLIYGKAGYAQFDGDAGQKTTNPGYVTNRSGSLSGVVYGVGAEYMATDRMSFRVEYARFDFGAVTGDQTSVSDPPVGFVYTNRTDATVDTIKAGVSFKLN